VLGTVYILKLLNKHVKHLLRNPMKKQLSYNGFGSTLLEISPIKKTRNLIERDGWFQSRPVFHKKKENAN